MPKHSEEVRKRYASGKRYSEEASAKIRKANCNRWLAKAKRKHGSKFIYDEAIKKFQTQKEPEVPIICTKHNHKFPITPDQHIQRKFAGCIHCKREHIKAIRIERERPKFLKWFKENLIDRLEIKSEFKGMTELMTFRCKIHDITEKHPPTDLMTASRRIWGCSKCAAEATGKAKRLDTKKLAKKLKPDLPKGVNIHKIEFDEEAAATRITLDCDIHGIQKPIGYSQFKSSTEKCPMCGRERRGYTETRLRKLIENNEKGYPCSVAVMEIEALGIKALKVGVTTRTLEERYRESLKKVFYEVRPLEIDAYVLENRIKSKFFDDKDERIIKKGMREGNRWEGDTELYWFKCKEPIIALMKDFIADLKSNEIDYQKELDSIIIPTPFPRSSNFEAGEFQGPIPIIGIDATTNEILYRFNSMQEAKDLGFGNISTKISIETERQTSKEIRWFKAADFDPNNIPPLEIPNAKPVYCVERKQIFRSTKEAEEKMRKLGFLVSGSKISMVLSGRRKKAGGFTWEPSTLSTTEILAQDPNGFIDYEPPKNSNEKKRIKLVSEKDGVEEVFESISAAGSFLKTSAGNITRAIDKNRVVKGYKAELFEDE